MIELSDLKRLIKRLALQTKKVVVMSERCEKESKESEIEREGENCSSREKSVES